MINWLENHLTTCFFKSSFGLECPGCGMQRALIALLKGNFSESLHHHPALIPFIITLIALIMQIKFNHAKGGLIVLWLFIATTLITLINYGIKIYGAWHF